MSDLDQQFYEDRELRNAAKAVLLADIEHARTSFSAKGVAERIGGRIGDGARDVVDIAKDHADDNRGIIAILIGALFLWISREPLLELLGLSDQSEMSEETSADHGTPAPIDAEQVEGDNQTPSDIPIGGDHEQ